MAENSLDKRVVTDPWERLEGETNSAFGAFCIYRDLPTMRRSIVKAVTQLYGEPQVAKVRQWQKWSAANRWVKRVAAWDDYVDQQSRAEILKAIADMRKRHIHESQLVQQVATEHLLSMMKVTQAASGKIDAELAEGYLPETPMPLTATQILNYIEAGIQQERISTLSDNTTDDGNSELQGDGVVIYLPSNKRDAVE